MSTNDLPTITDQTILKMDLKTAGVIIATVAAGAIAFTSIKADIADLNRRADSAASVQKIDHDILLQLHGALAAKPPPLSFSAGGAGAGAASSR